MKLPWLICATLSALVVALAIGFILRPTKHDTVTVTKTRLLAPTSTQEWGTLLKQYKVDVKYDKQVGLYCTPLFGDQVTWIVKYCELQQGPSG